MTAEFEAQFLDGPSGRLFSLHFSPVGASRNHVIIHVPAFCEEMNKSRRMVALQGRSFASLGYDVLLFDLFGTGDSAGDFANASWEAWLQDLFFLWDLAEQKRFRAISLWGLRLGCLLASDFLVRYQKKASSVLLWQPPVNGKILLTQFLRLRVASAMIGDGPKESTKTLIDILADGHHLEVAGYNLAPELARSILHSRLDSLSPANFDRLLWLELSNLPNVELLPSSLRVVDNLHAPNSVLTSKALKGTAFWATQEITEVHDLIRATENLFL